MSKISFEEVVRAARALPQEQKAALLMTLKMEVAPPARLSREQLLADIAALRAAGAFDHPISASGRYAVPGVPYPSEAELNQVIHDAATAYEAELDESE